MCFYLSGPIQIPKLIATIETFSPNWKLGKLALWRSPRVHEKRPTSRLGSANRRSTRLALNAGITLSGHGPKCLFTIPAKATRLNRHGAAIQLNRGLMIGSTIVLQNNKHHTTQVSARVVTQISAHHQGIYTYGVEFLEADAARRKFWGIYFP